MVLEMFQKPKELDFETLRYLNFELLLRLAWRADNLSPTLRLFLDIAKR